MFPITDRDKAGIGGITAALAALLTHWVGPEIGVAAAGLVTAVAVYFFPNKES